MFFEFITKNNEQIAININLILFITSYKNTTIIYDTDGNDYRTNESYTSIINRLNDLKSLKTWQNG